MSAPLVTAPEPRLGSRIVSLAEIADAAVELLHGASLSRPFIARREWLPRFDLAEVGTETKVSVSAGDTYTSTRLARDLWQRDPEIRVTILGLLADEPFDAEVDALMAFVEEVRDLFSFADLPMDSAISCGANLRAIAIDADPPLSFDALEQLRQFTAVLSITYRVHDAN
jgi:hypothetical protein